MNEFIKIENGTMTVSLPGELDHHGAAMVRDDIDTALFSEKPTALVFDLRGVEFMDSSGLGLILGRYARASVLGIPVYAKNPSVRQKRLLEMARMQNIVKIIEEDKK